MGYEEDVASSAIRVSLGLETTEDEVQQFARLGWLHMSGFWHASGQIGNMMAMDDVQVKDGVDAETVEAVKALSGTYKYGWKQKLRWNMRQRVCPRISFA